MLDALRSELIAAYKPSRKEGVACVVCGAADREVSMHLLEFSQDQKAVVPPSFVPMSVSRGRLRGSVPICVMCSPACHRCGLPISTRWLGRVAKALQQVHQAVTVVPGNGYCRHAHLMHSLLTLLKPVPAGMRASSKLREGDTLVRVAAAVRRCEESEEIAAFYILKPQITALLKDKDRTRASIEEDGLSPEALVYLLISNVSNELLASGRFHIYRGVLSGEGHQLLAAFSLASKRMMELGTQSEAEHEADMQSLRKAIREAG